MDSYLKAQLKQTVYIAAPGVLDEAGQLQPGTPVAYLCRVEPHYRDVPMYGGTEERTEHMVILDEAFPLSEVQMRNALVWLPGYNQASLEQARKAKVTTYCYDENGVLDHLEVVV